MKFLFLFFLIVLLHAQDYDLSTAPNEFLIPMKRTHVMTESPQVSSESPQGFERSNSAENIPMPMHYEKPSDQQNADMDNSAPSRKVSKGEMKSNEDTLQEDLLDKIDEEPLRKAEKPKINQPSQSGVNDRFQVLEEALKKYLAPPEETVITQNKASAWQTNINYIEPLYLRTFVRKLVVSRPIASWPLCVKTLVFPQVYSYYPVSVLKPQLLKVYQSTVGEAREGQDSKVDLLEKLMKLEELKKNVEIAILDQTEKLLEARKYDERTEKLLKYLSKQEEKISKVDEILEDVNK